jgi:hypothetical protein
MSPPTGMTTILQIPCDPAADGGWSVSVYSINAAVDGLEHRLERHEFELLADGSITDERAELLTDDLPLPFYMR